LGISASRRFNTGRIDIDTSLTYGSIFDRDGNIFDDPDRFTVPSNAPIGKRWRSHFYLDGYFQPSDFWTYGYGVQLASDDNYLNRYDLSERPSTRGIYESESRRNTSQAYVVGQDDNTRFSVSTVGFQDLRSRFIELTDGRILFREDDNAELPIVAPKIEVEHYLSDPAFNGRLKVYGDTTWITREDGTDYGRATTGLDYSKTWIAPLGLEVQPFANARFDYFNIEAQDQASSNFTRSLGQVGVDVRYPFIKTAENINFIIEPRAQITQSFGDGKLDRFQAFDENGFALNLQQDGTDIDLDQALFWQSNKATGFDFWQEGLRADIGASFIADWDRSRAHLFLGQSYVSGVDESSFNNLNNPVLNIPNAPREELSGSVGLKITDKWKTTYRGFYDIDSNNLRRQRVGLTYQDDCTLIEVFYNKVNVSNDAVRDTSGFGIRLALLTLGDTGSGR